MSLFSHEPNTNKADAFTCSSPCTHPGICREEQLLRPRRASRLFTQHVASTRLHDLTCTFHFTIVRKPSFKAPSPWTSAKSAKGGGQAKPSPAATHASQKHVYGANANRSAACTPTFTTASRSPTTRAWHSIRSSTPVSLRFRRAQGWRSRWKSPSRRSWSRRGCFTVQGGRFPAAA
jgi:hypothetical protein